MRNHRSTIMLVILFFTGLSVLLYPCVADYINAKHQSRAIVAYMEAMRQADPAQFAAELAEARAYNEAIRSDNTRFSPGEEELAAYHHMLGANNDAIGYLEIPAIRVNLPMYLGTEESILQVGIGCLPGSSLPVGGSGTHAVLTGHRGLPSSRLLTDLDQVEIGDTFTMVVLNEPMTYQVDQIRIVLPQELSDLAIEAEKDYCTLVTCTPYGVNSHRMLVRGHRIENPAMAAQTARVVADAIQVDPVLVMPMVAAPLLLVFLAVILGQEKGGLGENNRPPRS